MAEVRDSENAILQLLYAGHFCSQVKLKMAEFVQTPQLPPSGRFAMAFSFDCGASGRHIAAQLGIAKVCGTRLVSYIQPQDDGLLLGERNRRLYRGFCTGDRVTVCMDVAARNISFFINNEFLFASPFEEEEEPPGCRFVFRVWSRPPPGQNVLVSASPAEWMPTPPVEMWHM